MITRAPLHELALERKRFYVKEDIKPWLMECLMEQRGIHIVIERLDANKIIFKCKNRNKRDEPKQERTTARRQTTCPFKIRANYSIKNKYWTLVVINDGHDHEIEKKTTTTTYQGSSYQGVSYQGGSYTGGQHQKTLSVSEAQSHMGSLGSLHSSGSIGSIGSMGSSSSVSSAKTSGTVSNASVPPPVPSSSRGPSIGLARPVAPSKYKEPEMFDMFEHPPPLSLPSSSTISSGSDVFSVMGSSNSIPSVGLESSKRVGKLGSQSYFSLSPNSRKRSLGLVSTKRPKVDNIQGPKPEVDLKSSDDVSLYLRKEINELVNRTITSNAMFGPKEKESLLDSVASQFVLDHKDCLSERFLVLLHQNESNTSSSNSTSSKNNIKLSVPALQQQYQDRKSLLTSWLSTPPSLATTLNNATTNLIPLSPLLNDPDNEYNGPAIDNQTQSSIAIPNQVLQIQNQSQQLPSFNSIQNQLPLSPGNNPLAVFGPSLIPPITNSSINTNTTNTLNPSHLVKNNLLGRNSSNGLLDIKRNTSNEPSHQPNQLKSSSFFSGMASSGNNSTYARDNSSNSSIHNIGNFTDSGW